MALAHEAGHVAFDARTSSPDPLQADLVGVSLAVNPGEACYIPIGHRVGADDLFGGGGLVPDQIREEDALALLKPLMEAPGVLKIGHDVKFGMQALAHRGVTVAPIDDTMLISYALDGGLAGVHGLDELSEKTLGHKPIALNAVTGSGRNFIGFARVAVDKATEYAAENADVTMRLWRALKPRLAAEHVTTVYETLERPLVPVLSRMERRGVAIDRDMLSRLAGDFAQSHGAARGRDRENGRRAVQSGVAEAARRHPVRPDGTARGQANGDRRLVDDGQRARGACGRGPRAAGAHSRMAAGLETQIDLRRRAAGLCQPAYRPGAHVLRARRHDDRAAVVVGAQSAEHSRSARRRAARSAAPSSPRPATS